VSDVCLMTSDVCRVHPAGWPQRPDVWDGAYWLIGPGSAGLAQGCHCALPLQGAGAYCGGLPHSLLVKFSVLAK